MARTTPLIRNNGHIASHLAAGACSSFAMLPLSAFAGMPVGDPVLPGVWPSESVPAGGHWMLNVYQAAYEAARRKVRIDEHRRWTLVSLN